MKSLGKRLFQLSLLLFVLGAAGLVWLLTKQDSFTFQVQKMNEQRTVHEAVKGLEVKAETADVIVTISNSVTAPIARLVGETSDRQHERIVFDSEVAPDGTWRLTVREPMEIGWFFPVNGHLELQVTLPEAAYEKMNVQTATGDIKSSAFQAKTALIRSSTGNVDLGGFSGEQLDVKTDTGDMDLTDIHSALNIRSSTGDVKRLDLPQLAHDVEIRTDTGDIRVSVDQQPTSAALSLDTDTGEVRVDWPNLSYERKEEHQVKGTIGGGGPSLNVQTSTGDIRIQ